MGESVPIIPKWCDIAAKSITSWMIEVLDNDQDLDEESLHCMMSRIIHKSYMDSIRTVYKEPDADENLVQE